MIRRRFATETRKQRRQRLAQEALMAKVTYPRHNGWIQGNTSRWQSVIGVELHAQIATTHKLFSRCPVSGLDTAPNAWVARVDAALPGALPVLNRDCVALAVKTSVALGGEVRHVSFFDRKHYFYPDMPAGFQITQHRRPLAKGGFVDVSVEGMSRRVRIEHLQLEQDSGKTVHGASDDHVLVDLNRAGAALMEIVSAPDMRSAQEAGAYVRHMQRLLKAVGACSGNMDQGDLRCDINVSVRKVPEGVVDVDSLDTPFGQRVEVKNVNSIRFLSAAIDFEIDRHIALLESGGKIVGETRSYDARNQRTEHMRNKEEAVDYRFMPEPDVAPLRITPEELNAWSRLPPLPAEIQEQLMDQHGLSAVDAITLIDEPGALAFFEATILAGADGNSAARWILNDVLAVARRESVGVDECGVSPQRLAELIAGLDANAFGGPTAKRVLSCIIEGDTRSCSEIVAAKGWTPVDDDALKEICVSVVALADTVPAAQKARDRVRAGDDRGLRFFAGRVAKETDGRADPQTTIEMLTDLLASRD